VFTCQLFATNDGEWTTSFREGEIQETNAGNRGSKRLFTVLTPELWCGDKMPRMLPAISDSCCDPQPSSFPARAHQGENRSSKSR